MEGNISLAPVQVSWGKMKIWRQRDTGTGQQEPKLSEAKLQKLLTDIGELLSNRSMLCGYWRLM